MRCRRCGARVRPPYRCPHCDAPTFPYAAFTIEPDPERPRYEVVFLSREREHRVERAPAGDPDGILLRNLAEELGELLNAARPERVIGADTPPWLVDRVERIAGVECELHRGGLESAVEQLRTELEARDRLPTVDSPPERKLGGSHSTIIGGRRGRELLLRVAALPYVKRVIPGRIGAKGSRGGGGVRLKVTRTDERGNLKLLLSEGAATQEIFLVTTARSAREGRLIARLVERVIREAAAPAASAAGR